MDRREMLLSLTGLVAAPRSLARRTPLSQLLRRSRSLHRTIGRDQIAARIAEPNAVFREGAAAMSNVTLHTPRDPSVSGGISCFEVTGLAAEQVTHRLGEQKIRTSDSPYRTSYPRVAAGIMNTPEEIDRVLAAVRELR